MTGRELASIRKALGAFEARSPEEALRMLLEASGAEDDGMFLVWREDPIEFWDEFAEEAGF